MRKPPNAEWRKLMAISQQLHDAPDATTAIVVDTIGADVPYNRVLSICQAWRNKYARCTHRGLIRYPYRMRRNRLEDGGYEIEAVRDLTPVIETVMISWPEGMEPE